MQKYKNIIIIQFVFEYVYNFFLIYDVYYKKMSLDILKSKIENISSKKHLMKIFKIIFDNDENYLLN